MLVLVRSSQIKLNENTKRRVSGFALKLREKLKARKESDAGMEGEETKEEGAEGGKASAWGMFKAKEETKPKVEIPFSKPKKGRRKSSVADTQQVSFVQVAIAAAAKKKQKVVLKEVIKEATEMPPDMLQYDLIEIKPSQASTSAANHFLRTGYQWQVQKNYNVARDFYSKALVAERRSVQGWFSRGVCNDKMGNLYKALQDFTNALNIREEAEERRARQRKIDKKADKKKEGERKRPQSAGGASETRESEHYKSNQEVDSTKILFNRALVNVHAGDDVAALRDLEDALRRTPSDIRARGARAMIQRRLGNFLECQRDYTKVEQIKKEQKLREVEMLMRGHKEGAEEKTKAKAKRPSTAPSKRSKKRVSSTNDKNRPKEEMTPFEAVEVGQEEQMNVKDAELRRALEEGLKKERQTRRETRGGNLGGLASTVDGTPPASPTHKKLSRSDREHLQDLKLTITEDIKLVDSSDDEDDGDKDKGNLEGENRDIVTPLPASETVTSVASERRVSFTPLASTRSRGSFISKGELLMNAPTLTQVKKSLGVDDELYDKLFSVPTPLQVSLCIPPLKRGMKDLKTIIRVLRDYELTKDLAEDDFYDLARKVEYRTVVHSHAAYLQGEVADSLVFVVSGTVQVKMRDTKQDTVVTGTVERGGWFNDGAMLLKGARRGTRYYDSTVRPQLKDEDAALHDEACGGKEEEEKKKKESMAFREKPAALRETYYCSTNCEFLLFSAPLFEKYFKKACNDQQKAKFLALKRSMIFKGWSIDAIVRLARMSRMVTIPRNEKVVKQNEECDSMYFLVKGVVIVSKFPDKVAQLERTLRDLKIELSKSRTKYSFHRSMQLSKSKTMSSKLTSRKLSFARGTQRILGGEGVMIPEEAISTGERKQEEIERSIETVMRIIKSCKNRKKVLEDQELKVLVPPDFFGGEALLEPVDGKAYGTVTTDTVIHAVKVHKAILRTFKVDRVLLEKVKTMATHFPNDIVLEDEIRMNQG